MQSVVDRERLSSMIHCPHKYLLEVTCIFEATSSKYKCILSFIYLHLIQLILISIFVLNDNKLFSYGDTYIFLQRLSKKRGD